MSDLAFVLIVFAYMVVFGIVTYFKTIPSSPIARFLQKPEWMAVFLLLLVSILFGVHLPNDIFYLLVLTIFLVPLVFHPTEESRHLTAQSHHV